MAPSTTSRMVTTAALLACAGLGGYSVIATGLHSGLFAVLTAASQAADPYVPGGPAPFRTSYTGIDGLDKHLMSLITSFSFLTDGPQTWSTTLAYWYLMMQLFAGWDLVVLEGHRRGNRGRAVSWSVSVCLFLSVLHQISSPARH